MGLGFGLTPFLLCCQPYYPELEAVDAECGQRGLDLMTVPVQLFIGKVPFGWN